jgi:TPR repeat protein
MICGIAALAAPILVSAAKQDAKQSDVHNLAKKNSIRTVGSTTLRAPTAAEISLDDWGVHPSLESLPYLERTVEGEVLEAIESGQPVIIIGRSMAGKTRMASKLVQDLFPKRQVIMPDPPDGLAVLMATGEVPHEAVVWLDDLERYLMDPKNLKTRWIDDLRDASNIIVATMRASQYEAFQPSATTPKTQWETLNKFRRVHMLDNSQENMQLAASTKNPRLRQGILDYGLGIYVGGGYIALDRIKVGVSNTPIGVAMVRAAIDWQRSGIGEAIPHDIMLEALASYVDPRNAPTEENLSHALSWASDTSPLGGSVGLITQEKGCWRPFDFLVDQVAASGVSIPRKTWQLVASHEAAPALLNNAGLTANVHGQSDVKEILFRRAAEAGDPEGMANWAHYLDLQDRHEEAFNFYEKSADLGSSHGMTGLGIALMRAGKTDEAEVQLRRAADLGNSDGMANLGNLLLVNRKKVEEGVDWYRKASDAGSAYGMTNYGLELAKLGRHKEAEDLYRKAASMNSAGGLFELSEVFARRQDNDQSEALCRRAVDGGNPAAMLKLAAIVLARGDVDEAENLHRRAAGRGPGFMASLGSFLAQRERVDEAEPILKQAAELGEPYAYHCLGVIAAGRGELEQAKEHYRIAIQDGSAQSMVNLAQLLIYTEGDEEVIEQLSRDAAELGNGQGMALLAIVYRQRGDDKKATSFLEKAKKANDAAAAMALYETISRDIEKSK